jgi:hypothetical protein
MSKKRPGRPLDSERRTPNACDRVVGDAVGAGLSALHHWDGILGGRVVWSRGSTKSLARLGAAAYRGHGSIVRPAADCVLRRQRRKPAALASASPRHILVAADQRRYSADPVCADSPSIGIGSAVAVLRDAASVQSGASGTPSQLRLSTRRFFRSASATCPSAPPVRAARADRPSASAGRGVDRCGRGVR